MHDLSVAKELRTRLYLTLESRADGVHSVRHAYPRTRQSDFWSLSLSKRLLDIVVAALVLAVFALPMLLISILIRLTSKGPVIFVQQRVGLNGRHFSIYKFRSMVTNTGMRKGPSLTKEGDDRITAVGRWLRKFKMDELPQFYNVLRGDMSLVGPRPKLPQYAEQRCLRFRPGITGAATIAFRSEEEILKQIDAVHLDHFYLRRIKPLKERIDLRYMRKATMWSDLGLIVKTLKVAFEPARIPGSFRAMEQSWQDQHTRPKKVDVRVVPVEASRVLAKADCELAMVD